MIKNRDAFIAYNEERKKRALSVIPKEKRAVFVSIPFLLHTNRLDLPGYVGSDISPYGIYGFELKDTDLRELRILFPKNAALKKKVDELSQEISPPCPFIESVLLMGSIGSVAHTKASDFDYWVCIDLKNYTTDSFRLLKKKLSLIKGWVSANYKMEVNFFVVDISRAQADDFGEVDKESAGSSQGKILKEECYRTLILLAGKIPLWWIAPVGASDEDYSKCREMLKTSKELNYSDFIDLGNVDTISPAEFFGAALWQINKAMNYPFKSVLKMALLEIFLDKSQKYDLLSNVLKKRVHEHCNTIKMLDPYAVMFDSIVTYNQQKGRKDVADFLKRCFYIKTEVKLNRSVEFKKGMDYREKIMMDYVDEWRWSDTLIGKLNNFKEWKFDNALALGRQVHKFLKDTYVRLSDKLKTEEEVKQKISDIDRTILGRKLFAIYSKQPNKVNFLERAFDEGMWQESLTFHALSPRGKNVSWQLYRGQLSKSNVDSPISQEMLIKTSKNILDIIIWLVYNKLSDGRTSFYLIPNLTSVGLAGIQKLITELQQFFPPADISHLDNNVLLENPKKVKFFLIVNFAANPWTKDIEELTVIYTTSWGELFFEHLDSQEGVQKVIDYMLEDSPKGISDFSDYYRIFTSKTTYSRKIISKLDNKIKEKLKVASYRY